MSAAVTSRAGGRDHGQAVHDAFVPKATYGPIFGSLVG